MSLRKWESTPISCDIFYGAPRLSDGPQSRMQQLVVSVQVHINRMSPLQAISAQCMQLGFTTAILPSPRQEGFRVHLEHIRL